MDTYTACSIIEGFDGSTHNDAEVFAAYQALINSGVVWQLQGFYGRTAKQLIDEGYCYIPEK
jgi:hypothetical protein